MVPSKVGGGPAKIPDTACRFSMATLWAGASPTSGQQPEPANWRNFSEEIYLTQDLREPIHTRVRKSWELNWQKRRPKRSFTQLKGANKLQIWRLKKWFVQGSDPQRSAEQTTASIATRAHAQAHDKASPCGHPTDQRDRLTHGLNFI